MMRRRKRRKTQPPCTNTAMVGIPHRSSYTAVFLRGVCYCYWFMVFFCQPAQHQSFVVQALSNEQLSSSSYNKNNNKNHGKRRVAVVGAGISGLTIAHVLQQSGRYHVQVLEAKDRIGGHVRSMEDPLLSVNTLNIGHATHMGMFVNLRLLLKHFDIAEWPVGRGPNHEPGLFRMTSVATSGDGQRFQPPLSDILSLSSWWQALVFYYDSFRRPTQRLDAYLHEKHGFYTPRFVSLVYWAMATFEFDKECDPEMGEYALGTARALLVTQVFFQFLLCEAFDGRLPAMIDQGLQKDLAKRIVQATTGQPEMWRQGVSKRFEDITINVPLASYFTADYGALMEKLADGAGCVLTNTTVERVLSLSSQRSGDGVDDKNDDVLLLETSNGLQMEADAIVFTTHPSTVENVLNPSDFPQHVQALQGMDSGAVGVRIVHAKDLPFSYPPPPQAHDNKDGNSHGAATHSADSALDFDKAMETKLRPPILGIFDISELTRTASGLPVKQQQPHRKEAGWLSIAYPMYRDTARNRHQHFLDSSSIPASSCLDETIYPWTRATPSFIQAQRQIVRLQGTKGIYITGQALTGVNKASELQVTNALNLCHDYFNVCPPWKYFVPCPMLPDCNDVDAFRQASTPWQALRLAAKSLIGSFVLTTLVTKLGVEFFEDQISTNHPVDS